VRQTIGWAVAALIVLAAGFGSERPPHGSEIATFIRRRSWRVQESVEAQTTLDEEQRKWVEEAQKMEREIRLWK